MDPLDYMNQGGLVIMAGLAVWLVKVVVNDIKHDVSSIKELLQKIATLLEK